MRLTDFKALTFDVYGTLIDWESGMVAALEAADRPRRARTCPRRDPARRTPATSRRSKRQTPGMPYSRAAGRRLQPSGRGMGRAPCWDECRLRPLGRRLARVPDGRGARLPQAALQAGDPVERRQRSFAASKREAAGRRSTRSTRRRTSAPTSRADATSTTCCDSSPASASRRARSCTRPRACSTTTRPPTAIGLQVCWIYRRHDRRASAQR